MFAVKYHHKNMEDWTFCTVNSEIKTFETKDAAESFAEMCRNATKKMNLDHVYVVESLES